MKNNDHLLRAYLRELIKESYDDTGGWVVTDQSAGQMLNAAFPFANFAKIVGGEALRTKSIVKMMAKGLGNSVKASLGGHVKDWNKPFVDYDKEVQKIKEMPWYKEGLESMQKMFKDEKGLTDLGIGLMILDPVGFFGMKAAMGGPSINQVKEGAKSFWDQVNLRSTQARKQFDDEIEKEYRDLEARLKSNGDDYIKKHMRGELDRDMDSYAFSVDSWIKQWPPNEISGLGKPEDVKKVLKALKTNKLLAESRKGRVLTEAPPTTATPKAATPANPAPASAAPPVKPPSTTTNTPPATTPASPSQPTSTDVQQILDIISRDTSLMAVPKETIKKVVEYFRTKKKVGREYYKPSADAQSVKANIDRNKENIVLQNKQAEKKAVLDGLYYRLKHAEREDPNMQTYMTKKINQVIGRIKALPPPLQSQPAK